MTAFAWNPDLLTRLGAFNPRVALARLALLAFATVCLMLAACGGGSADAPPPAESAPGAAPAVPPTITQQPASQTVIAGQAASFTVAATGTAPLSYRWQRNGVDIAGATATTYTLASSAAGDNGAVFRAIATNVAGSATSSDATLTVTVPAPVLTITPQPADVTVVAGATVSFSVGGTCSSGTLNIQWQRRANSDASFADVAGATATTYSFVTALSDSGAQVRANLNCGGQSGAASNVASLSVTAPASATLSLYPLVGLRDQARITGATVIDKLTDGSYAFFVGSQLKRLSADRLSITAITGNTQAGYADGAAATAQFNLPLGITHDASGVIYVADSQNHVIRRIGTDGTVSTLAGSAGQIGSTDGSGNAARFRQPSGIALGPDGDLYVADAGNNVIRRVTPSGVVSTYAGSGTAGFADGSPATAQFQFPIQLAVAANGDLIVADAFNQRVRRILRSGTGAGSVETLAGNGSPTIPGSDGIGTGATIPNPGSLVLQNNTVYVLDAGGLIRALDLTTRVVTTFAGSRTLGTGFADGPLGSAQFRDNLGLTAGAAGGLMVADDIGLRSVDAAGNVTTIAAANGFATDAGTGVLLQLPFSSGAIAVDSQGFVANYDSLSRAVRRVDGSGNVTLVAGLTGSFAGVVDGTGSAAQFSDYGISIAAGPGNVLYVGDRFVLRRIGADNAVTTLAGSTATFGGADGTGSAALFNRLFALAVGPNGDIFVADQGNNAIRRVNASGQVTTYAGVIGQSGRVDGSIAQARLQAPRSLTFTPDGTLWFTDGLGGAALRKVSPNGSTITSISGLPTGIGALASDASGTVYFMLNADTVSPGGLYAYNPATGTSTQLMVAGTDQVAHLGSVNPSLPAVQSIAVLGPKRLLASGTSGQLLLITIP